MIIFLKSVFSKIIILFFVDSYVLCTDLISFSSDDIAVNRYESEEIIYSPGSYAPIIHGYFTLREFDLPQELRLFILSFMCGSYVFDRMCNNVPILEKNDVGGGISDYKQEEMFFRGIGFFPQNIIAGIYFTQDCREIKLLQVKAQEFREVIIAPLVYRGKVNGNHRPLVCERTLEGLYGIRCKTDTCEWYVSSDRLAGIQIFQSFGRTKRMILVYLK